MSKRTMHLWLGELCVWMLETQPKPELNLSADIHFFSPFHLSFQIGTTGVPI